MRYAVGLLILALLTGCAALMPTPPQYAPQTAAVQLTAAPDLAYKQAYMALVGMQGQITSSDPALRHIAAVVKGAVLMHVTVEGQGHGSLVTIRGSILPNKIVFGEFTEVQDYASLLQKHS